MKRLLLFIAIIYLLSCENDEKSNTTKSINPQRKIDPILNDIVKKYPNYTKNNLVREKVADELTLKIDSVLNQGYLDDIPVRIFRIGKNPHGEGALVQFYTNNFDKDKLEILSDRLNFDIIGLMSEGMASSLKDNEEYYVYGRKLKRLTEKETFSIVNKVYYSPGIEISKNAIWDVFNFNIGDILEEVDSVRAVRN